MATPTPAQALRALSLVHGSRAELLSIRPAGNGLVVRVRRDGREQELRIGTADAAGTELLSDTDRGKIRSALLALHREPPDAA